MEIICKESQCKYQESQLFESHQITAIYYIYIISSLLPSLQPKLLWQPVLTVSQDLNKLTKLKKLTSWEGLDGMGWIGTTSLSDVFLCFGIDEITA